MSSIIPGCLLRYLADASDANVPVPARIVRDSGMAVTAGLLRNSFSRFI
jgi:hypothetical protein